MGFTVFHWSSYPVVCGCGGCFNPPTNLGVSTMPKTLGVWIEIGLQMHLQAARRKRGAGGSGSGASE